MFALTVAGAAVLAQFQSGRHGYPNGRRAAVDARGGVRRIAWFAVVALAYLALYLGVGLLVLRWLRRFVQPGVLLTGSSTSCSSSWAWSPPS